MKNIIPAINLFGGDKMTEGETGGGKSLKRSWSAVEIEKTLKKSERKTKTKKLVEELKEEEGTNETIPEG